LEAFGVRASKIIVVQPATDPERFSPAVDGSAWRRRLAPGGELLLLTVGRLQRRKGHDLVLRALASLLAEGLDLRYAIAGTGEERSRLESLAADLAVGARVTFLGAVPQDDLPSLYAACDVFVHPNRVEDGDFEGFGIVFLEAAATSKPTIGGRSGGVPESVEEGTTGLLVAGTDADALALALRRLASSAALRRQMGEAGRARVLSSFRWSRASSAIEAVHARLAGEPIRPTWASRRERTVGLRGRAADTD
jgi:phosphatidylinositol alpha-1,6-mannosyltransferase